LDKLSLIERKDGKIRLVLNFHQLTIYFSKNVKNECFKRFSITRFYCMGFLAYGQTSSKYSELVIVLRIHLHNTKDLTSSFEDLINLVACMLFENLIPFLMWFVPMVQV